MSGDTLVLGIGNVLWADEGFGVRAVAALDAGWAFPPSVTLMDGGTQGLYLLPHVQAARRLLVFDAVDYRLAPGTLHVVRDGDIPAYLGVGKMSLHQTCFQEVLSLANFSGHVLEHAVLVGVQPEVLMDFGGSLSQVVRGRLPEALDVALAILSQWGVAGVARDNIAGDSLMDSSLDLRAYESGRPDAEQACRIGDARFLAIRRAAQG